MGEGECGRDGRPRLTAQSFDNFGRRELAIEKRRAAPGQAPLAQKDGAIYLTLAPDAV
ncbi:MAG: hypothetical protein WBO09_10175 [Methylocystis silviterrae]|uniref:hypothetical protein n=1 Tax=Methylocystis silviterrae TaxID=2743612 RepID=UPI003C71CD7C